MLDNDNIMTANASEVVQKIPTDVKDYHKCSLCVIASIIFHIDTAYSVEKFGC